MKDNFNVIASIQRVYLTQTQHDGLEYQVPIGRKILRKHCTLRQTLSQYKSDMDLYWTNINNLIFIYIIVS